MLSKPLIKQQGIQGFTLLELVIAVAIFSLIGVAMHAQFSQILTAKERSETHAKRLQQVQRAWAIMQQDFEQIAPRRSRDTFGDAQPAVQSSDLNGVEFTRTGWTVSPFTTSNRSEILRIRYTLEEGDLMRAHWRFPDRGTEVNPDALTLLEGVESLSITYWSAPSSGSSGGASSGSGTQAFQKVEEWPPLSSNNLSSSEEGGVSAENLPLLIEVELTLQRLGPIRRLFRVIASHPYRSATSPNPSNNGQGGEQGGEGDEGG